MSLKVIIYKFLSVNQWQTVQCENKYVKFKFTKAIDSIRLN